MNRRHVTQLALLLFLSVSLPATAWAQPAANTYLDTISGPSRLFDFAVDNDLLVGVGEQNSQPVGVVFENAGAVPDSVFALTLPDGTGRFTHATLTGINRLVAVGPYQDSTSNSPQGVYVMYSNLVSNSIEWEQNLQPDSAKLTLTPLAVHVSPFTQSIHLAVAVSDSTLDSDQRVEIYELGLGTGLAVNTLQSPIIYEAGQPIVARFFGDTLFTWGKAAVAGTQLQPEITCWRFDSIVSQQADLIDSDADGSVENLIPHSVTPHPVTGDPVLGVSVTQSLSPTNTVGQAAAVVYRPTLGSVAQIDWSALGINPAETQVRTLDTLGAGSFIATIHTPDDAAGVAGAGDQLVYLDEALNPLWASNLLANPTASVTTIETLQEFDNQLYLAGQYRDLTPIGLQPDTSLYYVQTIDTISQVIVTACPNCIAPGDANADLFANVYDLLYLPAGVGAEGPARFLQAAVVAPAVPTSRWSAVFADSVNYAFADFNGDGSISFVDSLVLDSAYAFDTATVANPDSNNASAPLLRIVTNDSIALGPGDTLAFSIELGDAQQSASGVLGAAFSLRYPSEVIQSIELSLNGWLGTLNSSSARQFMRTDSALRQLDAALFRTDQQTTSGVGDIATGRIIITDNLDGKTLLTKLPLQFVQSRVIGTNAEPMPHRRSDAAIAEPSSREEAQPAYFGLYPNPVRDQIHISSAFTIEHVAIVGLDGRVLQATQDPHLNVSALPAGCYLVQVTFRNGQQLFRRVVVQR
ncbi:MAG: T9SS type A sorting domain-containing protein [Bacteroidota bacterium]